MIKPKFIADAIAAGESEHAERKRTTEEARVAAAIAERRRRLEQEAIDRADAERWFANELPEMIRRATANGVRSIRLDRWSFGWIIRVDTRYRNTGGWKETGSHTCTARSGWAVTSSKPSLRADNSRRGKSSHIVSAHELSAGKVKRS